MGLLMSVLVFSIGVLEAVACVEHVRQSYLPLDLGRKRRRLVLDLGSGTIRHRETRRSSEFQRDPHVFLRSIQAAVEEEGDEKESEELAAIFQGIEAHNIHSSQMMNHQDSVFLRVNDRDESGSRASSEISRTSTPNTVIMNMSPQLDENSSLEPCYIPSDSYCELSVLKSGEAFSCQKDLGITQIDTKKIMFINERELPLESIEDNRPDISEILLSSDTQNMSKDSSGLNITTKLLDNEKVEINEGNDIIKIVDEQGADFNSCLSEGIDEEKSNESRFSVNSLSTDVNNILATVEDKEVACRNDETGNNFYSILIKDEEKIDNIILIKNIESNVSQRAPIVSVDNNKITSSPSVPTTVHNEGIIIQDKGLEIDNKIKENSSTPTNSSIVETRNGETIEKSEILVKSQPHSGTEPLIENKGKNEICGTQLEQVKKSEKQSEQGEITRSSEIKNSVNVSLLHNNSELNKKEISFSDQSDSTGHLSEHKNSVVPKPENQPFQDASLPPIISEESETVSLQLNESNGKVLEPSIEKPFNDVSCLRMQEESETMPGAFTKITESTKEDVDNSEFTVAHKDQFGEIDRIITTDVSSVLNETITPGSVNLGKEVYEEARIDFVTKANTSNIIDSAKVGIDNNSNILEETCPKPDERKEPNDDLANQKIMVPKIPEAVTLEYDSVPIDNSTNLDSNRPKEQIVSTLQTIVSEDVVSINSKSSTAENNECKKNDEEKTLELPEIDKVEIKQANANNAHDQSDSMREDSKSEETIDVVRHGVNEPEDVLTVEEEFGSERKEPIIKSKPDEEYVRYLTDVVSEEHALVSKSDLVNHIDTQLPKNSKGPSLITEEVKLSIREKGIEEKTMPKKIDLDQVHQVCTYQEVDSEILVSKDTKSGAINTDLKHSMNGAVSKQATDQEESIFEDNITRNEVSKAPQNSKTNLQIQSNEEITSKDLLDVKESLKPLPQKETANFKGEKPSDQKAIQKETGVLAKQETLDIAPFDDDVTVLVGGTPPQNQFTPVEDISSPDKAFWLIFSGEYTKAMSKDWHSGHFCCWQCDESLTGQRYVLRDDHPYCIKCYEQVFANTCDECSKVIGIDSKDLSYKDKHWHEACFLCSKCRVSLVDKQFGSKADKIYCGNCYDAQFASRCDGCGQIFRAGTKKMEYKTRQWHEQCFCCCVCKSAIGTKSFIPREQEIYCATCYEEKFATRCVKCNKIITSGGVTYKNEPWHRECFTCTNCSTSLAGQRFTSRDEKPYCADCFGELFAKRCTACCKPITGIGGTRFISFEDRHWHNDCFICASCRSSLVGRGFITDAEDILCTECAKQKLM